MENHQDWTPVTISRTSKPAGGSAKEQELNVARRRGEQVETVKKFLGGQNKASKNLVPNAAKIDQDTGDYHVERVCFNFAKSLQEARLAKKLTQAQLAQMVNEKQNVINDYEAGRAIPNGQLITRLNKVLGVRLPPARSKKEKTPEAE